jgi:hypothetical protein
LPSSLKKVPSLEPLSPGRYRLQLTLSAQQKEKLELARDLMSHANPSGELSIVLERALDRADLTTRKAAFRPNNQPAAKLRSQRTIPPPDRVESTSEMLDVGRRPQRDNTR